MYLTKFVVKIALVSALLLLPLAFATGAYARESSPAEQNSLGNLTPDLAEALRGCSVASAFGDFPIKLESGNQLLNGFKFEDAYCAAMGEGDAAQVESSLHNGLLGMVTSATDIVLKQRPASGVVFAYENVNRIINPDYAMAADLYFPGTGYQVLQPIQAFWGWATGIAFSFMALVIVGVAFAMLFRAKLDGKTAVTIQNSIPSIALAMILIPLSYPISGLFIDGITVATNLFHGIIFSEGGPGRVVYDSGNGAGFTRPGGNQPLVYEPGETFYDTADQNENARGLYPDDPRLNPLYVGQLVGVGAIGDFINPENIPVINVLWAIPNTIIQLFQAMGQLRQLSSGQVQTNESSIGILVNFIFSIIWLVVAVKILFRLFKKYLVLILLPIVSPFIFATIAIPGQGTKLALDYLKQLGAASLAFIVTYILFLTGIVLANPAFQHSVLTAQGLEMGIPAVYAQDDSPDLPNAVSGNSTYTPPLFNGFLFNVSDLGDAAVDRATQLRPIFSLMAAVLFLSIPAILDDIDKRLKVEAKGLIPAFAKPAYDQLTNSTEVAFKKIPATAATLGKSASQYTSALYNRSSAGVPFADKKSGETIKDWRKSVADDRAAANATSNPLARAYLNTKAAIKQAGGDLAGQAISGQSNQVSQPGEAFDYTAVAKFSRDSGGIVVIDSSLVAGGKKEEGVLQLEKGEKSPSLYGNIYLKAETASTGLLTKLKADGGTIEMLVSLKNPGDFDASSGFFVSTASGLQLNGEKDKKVPIILTIPATTDPDDFNRNFEGKITVALRDRDNNFVEKKANVVVRIGKS